MRSTRAAEAVAELGSLGHIEFLVFAGRVSRRWRSEFADEDEQGSGSAAAFGSRQVRAAGRCGAFCRQAFRIYGWIRVMTMLWPNKALEATAGGAFSFAGSRGLAASRFGGASAFGRYALHVRTPNPTTMLPKLVAFASHRWTKRVLLVLWVLSLLWLVERSYVWERHESTDYGVIVSKNFWEFKRTPTFVWLTLILAGYVAVHFKKRSLGYYGLAEVVCGVLGGFIALQKLPFDTAPAWFAIAASAFIVLRGSENIAKGVETQKAIKAKTDAPERA